jgi:ATP-dependent helicase/nuclease subunit A
MQSIYFFRDADAELFSRVRVLGLELPDADPLPLEFVPLSSNFRTAPQLVDELNQVFTRIFAANDGSGIEFASAEAARQRDLVRQPRLSLHIDFIPQTIRASTTDQDTLRRKQETVERRIAIHEKQTSEIVELIRGFHDRIEAARAHGDKFRIAILGRTYAALKPIAAALRDVAISFRAVDLENLCERPEVQDALAMTRALLNPEDRVAWLGVLRAPWAGLSLSDLHILAGADDPLLFRRPLPELTGARLNLLSPHGRAAAERVIEAFNMARTLRAAEPSASLGAWLEQVWLGLGGADCVDIVGRANLELLWKRIDMLDDGELDLFGPGLDAALADLNALPDPAASSDYGVQLMSIHKSKGLEFEVVIVPELEAGCRRGEYRLLSWLERGLESADESGDVTEFLVAPVQSKGAESGKCKSWVDRVYRQREAQEMRRILYVSATRAREELHLFARPEYRSGQNGSYTLCDPRDSLLATAWPALGREISLRFDRWVNVPDDVEVGAIAASNASDLIEMPRLTRPAIIRRLPLHYVRPPSKYDPAQAVDTIARTGNPQLYQRHEGGAVSRALGSAVHLLLEELAYLRTIHDWAEARDALRTTHPMAVARLRSTGLDERHAARVAAQAMDIAIRASEDSAGQWILSPHPDAASEVRWAGIIAGVLHEVRVDRIFRAGTASGSEDADCWWIVDYKTASHNATDSESLLKLRSLFAPQLELYAQVLRNMHGATVAIRGGLYYPRTLAFDSWNL